VNLTIVMYHYVRDLARSRYPAIKGRDTREFRRQLDFIQAHHNVVRVDQIVEALRGGEALPPNAVWLTFDDGYLDHYCEVFPLLHERGLQGSFFAPVNTLRDRILLDVNRIHFILAAHQNLDDIVRAIKAYVDGRGDLPGFAEYWGELAIASRFDRAEVIFIKRMLQRNLPAADRAKLTADLFARFVSIDEETFASELYLSEDQAKTMLRCGMFFGSHGVAHRWMNELSEADQRSEVEESRSYLAALGAEAGDWVMCFPHGGHNASLRSLLKENGCAIGLSTRVAVADLAVDDHLALPRMDTNDIHF
jgi:peptidoglycan/xylan/chitin deacetylase (PgdA/CDA1 family)